MSSYKKRQKTLKRTHRERGQVHTRQHLGLLEKHRDYVLRAKDYQRKKAQLKHMHEKARNRNPDEFYYKMVKTKLKDGRHVIPQDEETYSLEELQLMKTQDKKYIQMKLAMETKKVERLKSSLHYTKLMKTCPPNNHIIFVDSTEEVTRYKEAHEAKEARGRSERKVDSGARAEEVVRADREDTTTRSKNTYKELNQRMRRCKELSKVASKMKTQKDLMGKGHRIKVKGDGSGPAVYKWKPERQR